MKSLCRLAVFLATLAVATGVLAGPPLDGNYQSTDLGGPIPVGRYTEGWMSGGGAMLAGTTFNAASYDGASLGTVWKYTCGSLASDAMLLVDTVDANGNGNRTYMKTFVGGTIWLSGSGPWANGDPEYSGPITSYTEFETVQYSNWQRVGVVTNVQARASFDGYPGLCVAFAVANGVEVGSTDYGQVKPADFPEFLYEGSCAPGAPEGAWWDMQAITLSIDYCAVNTEQTSWGTIKAQFED